MPSFSFEDLLGVDEAPILPPGRNNADVAGVHRDRLCAAALREVADRGYHETTVADIVRSARVSRRTFYLHFASKEECFFAACDLATAALLERLTNVALRERGSGKGRLVGVLAAYLDGSVSQPGLVRIFQLEIRRAGPVGMARHRAFRDRWATALRAELAALRRSDPAIGAATTELTQQQAASLVGAISESVVRLAESDDAAADLPAARRMLVSMVLGAVSIEAQTWTDRLDPALPPGPAADPDIPVSTPRKRARSASV